MEAKIMNDDNPEDSKALSKIINHSSYSEGQRSEIHNAFYMAKDWNEFLEWLMESKIILENTGFFPPFRK